MSKPKVRWRPFLLIPANGSPTSWYLVAEHDWKKHGLDCLSKPLEASCIERVQIIDDFDKKKWMWVDENGRMMQKKYNARATMLYWRKRVSDSPIVGDVLIECKTIKEDLPESQFRLHFLQQYNPLSLLPIGPGEIYNHEAAPQAT